MNEFEIDMASHRYARHPVLGPATQTLVRLKTWTNDHSDGWPYWQPPRRAASRLVALIEGNGTAEHHAWIRGQDDDTLAAEYRKALRPLRAFRTKVTTKPVYGNREPMPGFDIIEVS